MSVESVRAFFARKAPDLRIVELDVSTATVAQAAAAHDVEPRRIAKTLSLRIGDRIVLIVVAGDARLDNKKFKAAFGAKPRLLDAEEVADITGHPVGGVCPFGWPRRCPSIAINPCAILAKSCRRPARPTPPFGSRLCGSPTSSAPNGWMCASSADAPYGISWPPLTSMI
jgi:prolyl-tRNA editing enzyme YbaK/EbsC (Cys-tRNA(Pro) deacylase)